MLTHICNELNTKFSKRNMTKLQQKYHKKIQNDKNS